MEEPGLNQIGPKLIHGLIKELSVQKGVDSLIVELQVHNLARHTDLT